MSKEDELYRIRKGLEEIEFFKKHNELIPFVGEDYLKYKILQVGESHYLPNGESDYRDGDGTDRKACWVNLSDLEKWWREGGEEKIESVSGWYNTRSVINDYMNSYRHKGHGIFTNVLKVFCESVATEEMFTAISWEDSKKYNYFAFMNFYQMPSIYAGMGFTKAFYKNGNYLCDKGVIGWDKNKIDELWYDVFGESAKVFNEVVSILNPKAIVVTSMEVEKYYKRYGSKNIAGEYSAGVLAEDTRMIYVDHPGCAWWNSVKKNRECSSKDYLGKQLKKIYGV